jgi:hypothetical protein
MVICTNIVRVSVSTEVADYLNVRENSSYAQEMFQKLGEGTIFKFDLEEELKIAAQESKQGMKYYY